MDTGRRILIAGLEPVMRHVRKTLASDYVTISAEYMEGAKRLLEEERPDCVVVGYHFDQLRAFRLIRYIRADAKLEVPIILVRPELQLRRE